MIDLTLQKSIDILKRKCAIPEGSETFDEISESYDYAIEQLEKLQEANLLPIKDNLDKRICDIEPDASNTQTYREFIVEGWKTLQTPFTEQQILELGKKTNYELNMIVEELDWLLDK